MAGLRQGKFLLEKQATGITTVQYNTLDCREKRTFIDDTGIMEEERAEKTDFYRESNSGSVTGSPVH